MLKHKIEKFDVRQFTRVLESHKLPRYFPLLMYAATSLLFWFYKLILILVSHVIHLAKTPYSSHHITLYSHYLF